MAVWNKGLKRDLKSGLVARFRAATYIQDCADGCNMREIAEENSKTRICLSRDAPGKIFDNGICCLGRKAYRSLLVGRNSVSLYDPWEQCRNWGQMQKLGKPMEITGWAQRGFI